VIVCCPMYVSCRYVYERLTPPGQKPTFMTLMVTQLVSGIWHGLYPGYIMFFAGETRCCRTEAEYFRWLSSAKQYLGVSGRVCSRSLTVLLAVCVWLCDILEGVCWGLFNRR
jgi:D-alanyl-lipoteichoic acid acyltransferase DltB (MBOAT superfamily)